MIKKTVIDLRYPDYTFSTSLLSKDEVVCITYTESMEMPLKAKDSVEIYCSKEEAEQIALAILEVIREPLEKPY